MDYRIAVVDDDAPTNDAYCEWLRGEYPRATITPFRTFREAAEGLSKGTFDLVLLDIELGPTMQERLGGFPLALLLRDKEIPVVIVSGTPREMLFKPIMTHLFAWDYLEKPVDQIELLSKAHQVLTRAGTTNESRDAASAVHAPNLVIDPLARHAVVWKGRYVPASITQVRILKYLVERQGQVVGYDELQVLCPSSRAKHAVRVHIKELRENFESVDEGFDRLATVTLKGYMWQSEEK